MGSASEWSHFWRSSTIFVSPSRSFASHSSCLIVAAVADLGGDALQDGARVALDTDVDAAVAADLVGVDVDRDHLRLRADGLPVAEAEVHHRAGEEDDVGLAEGGSARA